MKNEFGNFILDLIFPKFCLICKKYGTYICQKCMNELPYRPHPFCFVCKKRTPDGRICIKCSRQTSLTGFICALPYKNEDVKNIIHSFKYLFAKELKCDLANVLDFFIKKQNLFNDGNYELASIPLHKRRLKWRGFNQSGQLAEELQKLTGFKYCPDALIRIMNTTPQMEIKNTTDRENNVKDAFKIQNKNAIKNKKVILIDDVATTGATLQQAAKVLKRNKAKEVWGLVIAS